MAKRKSDNTSSSFFIIFLITVAVGAFLFFKFSGKPVNKKGNRKPPDVVAVKPVPAIKKAEKSQPAEPKPRLGQIAIIIDDAGYNLIPCEYFSRIEQPVTLSILPDLAFSQEVAACAHEQDKEVMLHLPLEPHLIKEKYPKNYMITTKMGAGQINKILNHALTVVPFVVGINNHTGSKATEDKRVMSLIFKRLKEDNLFFVDSMVTGKSVCKPLAQKMNLPFAQRDIFLDNKNTRSYIEGQFEQLAQEAKKKGYAIGIGHARRLTMQIIEEQTAKLSEQGYDIVTVQELIDRR